MHFPPRPYCCIRAWNVASAAASCSSLPLERKASSQYTSCHKSRTPQFAAPEQLLGERVDQRADIYSLAATAYFALLGRPPFEGPTPEAIVARQTTEDPPSLHDARKDVPRELEDVLRKALASEAAARYPTATAFRDALRRSRGLLFRLRALLWGK